MVLTRSQVKQQIQHKYQTRFQTSHEDMRQQYIKMMEQNQQNISEKVCKTPSVPISYVVRRSQRIKIMM